MFARTNTDRHTQTYGRQQKQYTCFAQHRIIGNCGNSYKNMQQLAIYAVVCCCSFARSHVTENIVVGGQRLATSTLSARGHLTARLLDWRRKCYCPWLARYGDGFSRWRHGCCNNGRRIECPSGKQLLCTNLRSSDNLVNLLQPTLVTTAQTTHLVYADRARALA